MNAEPLLVSDCEAAALAGVSRATWHRLRAAGKIPPAVRLGRSVRWSRAELVGWVAGGCPPAELWDEMKAATRRRGVG